MRVDHIQTTILHQQEPTQEYHLKSNSFKFTSQSHHSKTNVFDKITIKLKSLPAKLLITIALIVVACFIINGLLPKKNHHHGASYNFDISFDEMINKTDTEKIFGKRKTKEGITKQQLYQAIRKLQITNNVKYGGKVEPNITKFDNSKADKARKVQTLINEQIDYLQATYKINEFNKKQLPFCIVVPTYQNVETGLYLRNLNSIFMQNYTNYHVVYVDDGSKDGIEMQVKRYMLANDIPLQKIKIIVQENNRKPVYTIYNAITKYCKLGQLALIVEGDDALIGTNVLKLYNAIYQRDKCAMIYSNYLDIIDNTKVQLGVAHQIMDEYFQKNSLRTIFDIPGRYLLSFYVDIFKSIRESDFKDQNGYFFWYAYDRALITPLLQIAYPRIKVIKQILYEHRRTLDTESPKDWKRQSNQILIKEPYKPLKFFPFIQRNKYKYFFDAPIDKMIKNTDFTGYTLINNFQIEGVSKSMHIRSIKLTQIIHNVRYGGDIIVELADFEKSKQQKYKRIQKLLTQDKRYYNEKYDIQFYRKEELPFCIVTPSYNNVKSGLYFRNLDSIFMQDYNNYHVVYIDDCSPDKTGDYVKRYLQDRKIPKKHFQVVINKENKKAMYNLHMAIHKYCNLGEVVVIIDGDDSFIGRNVLGLYNAVYQRDGAAMAYSNFLTIHNNDRTQLGFCHDIDKVLFEQNTFRNTWDLPGTHLMSFYSDLFRKIKLSDLTYENGTFFDYAYDRAILTPLLEMAYPRISVIKQITYEYRNDTGINDAPDDWIRVSHIILNKQPYDHLEQFPFIKETTEYTMSSDKSKLKNSIQSLISNSDLSGYDKQADKKITGITKQQHLHAIKLTQIVQNVNFRGQVIETENSDENFETKKKNIQKLLKEDKAYLQTKYNLSKYKQAQLPFCIVVSSYSSIENGLYWRNLNSILMQDYKNFRVIYIDDNLEDQSEIYINKFLDQMEIPTSSNLLKIIKNQQTRMDLANIYYAAHNECKLNEIMLVVGDNDALLGRNVLSILNALYQKSQALVGFSCYLKIANSSSQLGKCADIDDFYFKTKTFRNRLQYEKYRMMSFYTYMFRRIKINDLTYENGSFFTNAFDKAIMTPLIEMAHPKILIAKQIMYEDRSSNESRDLIQQGTQTNLILSKTPYQKLPASQQKV